MPLPGVKNNCSMSTRGERKKEKNTITRGVDWTQAARACRPEKDGIGRAVRWLSTRLGKRPPYGPYPCLQRPLTP